MIFRRLAHTAISAATSAAILLTALLADAAPAPASPAPRCTATTAIRADGAIVTRTVCVLTADVRGGGK